MIQDTMRGRSVETVQAELRAVESRAGVATHAALEAHLDHLRREHEEALRTRRRDVEEELMAIPAGTSPSAASRSDAGGAS